MAILETRKTAHCMVLEIALVDRLMYSQTAVWVIIKVAVIGRWLLRGHY